MNPTTPAPDGGAGASRPPAVPLVRSRPAGTVPGTTRGDTRGNERQATMAVTTVEALDEEIALLRNNSSNLDRAELPALRELLDGLWNQRQLLAHGPRHTTTIRAR